MIHKLGDLGSGKKIAFGRLIAKSTISIVLMSFVFIMTVHPAKAGSVNNSSTSPLWSERDADDYLKDLKAGGLAARLGQLERTAFLKVLTEAGVKKSEIDQLLSEYPNIIKAELGAVEKSHGNPTAALVIGTVALASAAASSPAKAGEITANNPEARITALIGPRGHLLYGNLFRANPAEYDQVLDKYEIPSNQHEQYKRIMSGSASAQ